MSNVKVTINAAGVAALERAVAMGFSDFAEAVVKEAGPKSGSSRVARSAGTATFVEGRQVAGNASLSPKVRVGRGVEAWMGFDSPIAHLIELGTAPHPINVKNKRVLAGDGQVFGTSVSHPGTRARPFMTPTVLGLAGRLGDFVRGRMPR